jgi:hypothetical protein
VAEQLSMDNILSGEDPEPKAPEAPAPETKDPVEKQQAERNEVKVDQAQSRKKAWQDKEQEAQGRVRDPGTGQYVQKAKTAEPEVKADPAEPKAEPAKPAAAPQQEFTAKERAFLQAAQEERGKRQELERRLAALEGNKPAEEKKGFWDDPEAALEKHRQEIRTEAMNARLQTAEFIARQRHPDFDEKLAKFSELVEKTPGLFQKMLASPDPAEYAFGIGKGHLDIEQAGGMQALLEKKEKETAARVRAEVAVELREKAEALAKERAALPPSLSEARSTGPNKHVWGGPTSMNDILKG